MNFSLRPHPLVAQWVPGMVALFLILLSSFGWSYNSLVLVFASTPQGLVFSGVVLAVLAFVVGQILDAYRDSFLEDQWDDENGGKNKIRWNFFFEGEAERLKNLEEWYFTWYVLDVNLGSAIIIGLISTFLNLAVALVCKIFGMREAIIITLCMVGGVIIFFLFHKNARDLRNKEIKKVIDEWYEKHKDGE
jgi:hypothetical protein